MKKHSFRFRAVMRQREIIKEITHRDFVEVETVLEAQNNYKNKLEHQSSEARRLDQSQDWSKAGVILEEFITGQNIKIQKAQEDIKKTQRIVEEKREILRESVIQHKIMESLKERDLKEFKRERRKFEQKNIDELNSMKQRGQDDEGL